MNIEKIIKDANFTDDEKDFLGRLPMERDSVIQTARITSELLLSKKIDSATDKIIASNKELSKSNNKHSSRMLWLTGALVFVGFIQIIIQAVYIWSKP